MIEYSKDKTKIEQNLEGINYLNIKNIVNLNHSAFQDNESDSERQGIFNFDSIDLVTDLVNELENSDTKNIEI
ncbi:36522_t:CDS:2, partial [Gigaspora margarita]